MLPCGALLDWLRPGNRVWSPEPVETYVPAVRVLGGMLVTWEVRPDDEAAIVNWRRTHLVQQLAALAGMAEPPEPNPPTTMADYTAARSAATSSDEAELERRARERLLATASSHAVTRGLLRTWLNVLLTLEEEEFGGADPLFPEFRALLEDAEAVVQKFEELWHEAGLTLSVLLDLDPWPSIPDRAVEEQEASRGAFLQLLRAGRIDAATRESLGLLT
jgi:hypothetical protein